MSIEPLNNRIQHLERLLEIGRNLSAMLEIEPLLQTIIDVAADLTYSQEASILLYDEEHNNLEFVAAPWFKQAKLSEIRVPLENSIAGHVYTYGEHVLVQDTASDQRIYRNVDQETDFITSSILAVPMVFKGTITGVLTAVNKLSDMAYTEEDTTILKTLASQATIAIQNANLLEETKRAYEELSELDRMKTDFIAITSHELRTPLGLILGHSTFLQEIISDDLKPQMDVIVRNAMRLKGVIEDLSKVNNFASGQARLILSDVKLQETIEDVISKLENLTDEKKLKFSISLPEKDFAVQGDLEKISIALHHILHNAISFSHEGGEITILGERLPDFVKIDIIDQGVGIPEKDLERIFDRFYQIESHMTRRHGGMGLGLSVAKNMIDIHKGSINVVSEEGNGSTFSVILPVEQQEEER